MHILIQNPANGNSTNPQFYYLSDITHPANKCFVKP